jgi:CubicO group peptidase (beta-lactamase class C family)
MKGTCDSRFTVVASAFEENFADGLELGAACAVVIGGRVVVDIWDGRVGPRGDEWSADTLVDCRSATKGLTALCLHCLVDQGRVDLDVPLRRYWPELRADPTVRQALNHQAGIPVLDGLSPGAILDWHTIAQATEAQAPLWEPGERHGYHGVTFGWLTGEPVRRLSGVTLSEFFQDHVAGPLGADCLIGTPASAHQRVAELVSGLPAHREVAPLPEAAADPGAAPSLTQRMYAPVLPPLAPSMNDPTFRSAVIPVTGATGTAAAFAAIYGEIALGGGRLLSAEAVDRMGAVEVEGMDAVLGIPVRRGLGFEFTPSWADDGRPEHCFGHPGAGGVVTFADTAAGIGFAYLNNAAWGGAPGKDLRAARLTQALYASL